MIRNRALPLLLLLATAVPAQIGDLDPLVVEILDSEDRRLEGDGLPILFRGMRPQSIDQLQQWMRLVAAPAEDANQDRDAPAVMPPSEGYPRGQHPSNRTLIVRCSPHQEVAWVQAVVQAAWLLPWQRDRRSRVEASPLIQDVRIGLLDKNTRRPVAVLRGFRPKSDGSHPYLEDLLLRIFPEKGSPDGGPVTIQLGAYNSPMGTCKGYRIHPTNADAASFEFEPRLLGFRFREKVSAIRKKDSDAQVRVVPSLRVPFVLVHEMLQIIRANELTAVLDSSIALPTIQAMTRRYVKSKPRAADPTVAPSADRPGRDQRPVDATAIQQAADRGLAWLKRAQADDGRWDADKFPKAGVDGMLKGIAMYDVGVTGLALQAFQAHGHDHVTDGPYRKAIESALRWLVARQDAEGCIGSRGDPHFVYNHAMAARALIQAHGKSSSGRWKEAARNATNFILKAQNPYRAWRYGVRPGDNDSHVTSWMLAALAAAKDADLDVPKTSVDWALDFLDHVTDEETGRTGYTKRGERPVRAEGRHRRFPADQSEALTAAAMWCRLELRPSSGDSFMTLAGTELLTKRLPKWDTAGSIDMIYWYWGTLTLKRIGGPAWKVWRSRLKHELLDHQVSDGQHAGGFRPAGAWGMDGGAIYSTALMSHVLALLK